MVKNQRAAACETMAVHKPRAAATRGCVVGQKGTTTGLGKTCGSQPAKRQRSWTMACGDTCLAAAKRRQTAKAHVADSKCGPIVIVGVF